MSEAPEIPAGECLVCAEPGLYRPHLKANLCDDHASATDPLLEEIGLVQSATLENPAAEPVNTLEHRPAPCDVCGQWGKFRRCSRPYGEVFLALCDEHAAAEGVE